MSKLRAVKGGRIMELLIKEESRVAMESELR